MGPEFSVATERAQRARMGLGTAQEARLKWENNAVGVERSQQHILNLAQECGVYIPKVVETQFVHPSSLQNVVDAKAEYGQLGRASRDDLSKTMTWGA